MRALVINPKENQIKNDALGAFVPEAQAFIQIHGPRLEIDQLEFDPDEIKRDPLINTIAAKVYDVIAIFSHGLWDKMPQLHIAREHVPQLAEALTAPHVNIILYCCLLSAPHEGELNFAQTLAKELYVSGKSFDIWAHRTAGHTTRNPMIDHHYADKVDHYPTCLKSYSSRFVKMMRDPKNPIRFVYPFAQSANEEMRKVVEWSKK